METPVYTRLAAYHKKNRISFAMPGHKNMRALAGDLEQCDVTELAATLDLHHEDETVSRANELLSELYGSIRSFIMTGGSTAGVQAMLAGTLRPGDTLLASADCHKSVINTCALCGFRLRLLPVRYDEQFMIPSVTEDFEITPDIGAVMVTSPNYYGMAKDISALADKCHRAGVPLLADEAHGAHFIASEEFPETAVKQGADMVCQSAHKTLNALTGAAYLHICSGRVDTERVKRALRSFQTSSPPYPIAASADIARATLARTSYDNIIKECRDFCGAVQSMTGIRILKNDDPTRIVLNFGAYDTTGFAVNNRLSEYYGIDAEMADLANIVLIATPWNTHSDFMSLFQALRGITDNLRPCEKAGVAMPPVCTETVSPAEGWFARTELVPLTASAGRVCAAAVTPYPPGTVLILPGMVITKEQTEYVLRLLSAGAQVSGITDNRIEVVI